MKALVLVLSLVAASSSFAYEQEQSETVVAWCDQNNVIVLDSQTQQAKILVNCSDAQLTCKPFEIQRGFGTLISAKCE